MHVQQFVVKGLGHASYLVGSDHTKEVAVIDPRRDFQVYLDEANAAGFKIRYVAETHVHNDFLSGARPLAAETGAAHLASAEAGLHFDYRPVKEGDEFTLGDLTLQVQRTPGHTPEHVTYAVLDQAREPVAVFSGGDLLVGSVGRPDLLGREMGERLAPQLFDSLHQKILPLGDDVDVYPTHGFGSLCGRGIGKAATTTIAIEKDSNPFLQIEDRDEFVRFVLEGNPGIPTYYRNMRPGNQAGAPAWTLPRIEPLSAVEVQHRAGHGALVIDVRDPPLFGAGHIPGTVHIDLEDMFVTWAGWLLSPEVPLILVLQRPDQLDDAVTRLARIGFENIGGYLEGGFEAWEAARLPVQETEQWSVETLRDRLGSPDLQLVDVRMDSEWLDGHIEGATHITLGDLPQRMGEVDASRQTAIVCGSGFRSSIATSLLKRSGLERVANVAGGMIAWREAGLPTVPGN
jgi:hydroxyacylglutathione hydrolase